MRRRDVKLLLQRDNTVKTVGKASRGFERYWTERLNYTPRSLCCRRTDRDMMSFCRHDGGNGVIKMAVSLLNLRLSRTSALLDTMSFRSGVFIRHSDIGYKPPSARFRGGGCIQDSHSSNGVALDGTVPSSSMYLRAVCIGRRHISHRVSILWIIWRIVWYNFCEGCCCLSCSEVFIVMLRCLQENKSNLFCLGSVWLRNFVNTQMKISFSVRYADTKFVKICPNFRRCAKVSETALSSTSVERAA